MKRRGQIWVETVIYTLIGLSLIALVLAFVMPRINEARDRAVIQQSIDSLETIDNRVFSLIDSGEGNIRNVDLTIGRGKFFVDAENDRLYFVIGGVGEPYTEPGAEVPIGGVQILTTEVQKGYEVNAGLDYSNIIDFKYGPDVTDEIIDFDPVSIPYKFTMEHRGLSGDRIEILINVA